MSDTLIVGDRPPPALLAYLDRSGRDSGEAVDAFATDAVLAVPDARVIETGPRAVSVGRTAIRNCLREDMSAAHEIHLCATDAGSALVEGALLDTGGVRIASFAASMQLDSQGLLTRYLENQSTPVPMSPTDANPDSEAVPGSAIDRIHRYFHALDSGDFDAAASHFSTDTLYSHPPYRDPTVGGRGRANFFGRSDLVAAFGRRGSQDIGHEIVLHLQRGPHLLLEGAVTEPTGALLGTFVSTATLDGAGLIQRYVSFYCQPGLHRR